MPLIIRITAEDLAGWELTHKVGPSFGMGRMQTYHYRPRLAGELEQYAERIQVVSNWDLNDWVGKDMVGFVNVEKGWMSRDLGVRPEVKFKLKAPAEELRDPRRLRLKIKAIDTSTRPPRVTLEDYKLEDFKG
ncbi:MAG TPA: hypothetical protein VGQ12_00535 [Candidatus Angelobacter sp.]|jgi:hypothetical protein|nr:hypothetical protein [Candidatus Angelobacter sp.]